MIKALKIIGLIVLAAALVFGGYKLFFQEVNTEDTEIIAADENNNKSKKEKGSGKNDHYNENQESPLLRQLCRLCP